MLGGGGGVSHPLQLTTGLVINNSVTTSPTLAGERMLLIPKVAKYSVGTISKFLLSQKVCFLSYPHGKERKCTRAKHHSRLKQKWSSLDDDLNIAY